MKILLCYISHGASDAYHQYLLPAGLVTMHAVLQGAGHDSRLVNLSNCTAGEIRQLIRAERPELVGISQFTHNRFESLDLAAAVKQEIPSCIVVFGGPHAGHRYREVLQRYSMVDLVVIGEGEETFLEVANTISGERDAFAEQLKTVPGIAFRDKGDIVLTKGRVPIRDLDVLPPADLEPEKALGIDLHQQMEFIITSRGCPASCTFCASPHTWGKRLRFHSAAYIVDEIRRLRDRLGLIYFSIRDDTFTADRKRVLELCQRLLEENLYIMWNCQSRVNAVDDEMLAMMKRAGCECVQFGIETGSERLLKLLNKSATREQMISASSAVRHVGINLSIYLISGIPGETNADIKDTENLIARLLPHDGQVSPLAYYPGTGLFRAAVRDGLISDDAFEMLRDAALYAQPLAASRKATRRLISCLELAGRNAAFTREDFLDQKRRLGYCHATNIVAGEWYAASGDYDRCEQEFIEIIRREPENPWGWLTFGEFCGSLGRVDEAIEAFRHLAGVVPAHAPAYAALGELSKVRGRHREAADYFRKALSLNPYNDTARRELAVLNKTRRRP